jgi:hypothetical protein
MPQAFKQFVFTFSFASFLFCSAAFAQQPAPAAPAQDSGMEDRIRALEDKVIELEGQIRALKSQGAHSDRAAGPAQPTPNAAAGAPTTAAAAAAPPATPNPSAPATAAATEPGAAQTPATGAQEAAPPPPLTDQTVTGGAGQNAKLLNPDVSVIGDFVSSMGRNPIRPVPSLEMHESEVGLQAIIDPYARADFFISFGEEGVNLEEGYVTFTALPAGIVARVGKMRAAFGKVNTQHNHVLPWIDRPLVTENLVGGEDGIDDAGVSLSRIFAAPRGVVLEATGQVFRGDSADVFRANTRSSLSTVEHLRGYKDITESTNLDLGLSYAYGANPNSSVTFLPGTGTVTNYPYHTSLYGVDATLRYKPLRRAIYKSFTGRAEFIWNQAQSNLQSGTGTPFNRFSRSFGYYASSDYQFARRWTFGARYDHSDRQFQDFLTDQGGSLVLTYRPTEFSVIRGQYRITNYAEKITTNELRFQVQFAIGAHGAHPF